MNYGMVAVNVVKKAREVIPIKGIPRNQIRRRGTKHGNETWERRVHL